MKIGIASDHRGYKLKSKIIKYLNKKNIKFIDFGTDNSDNSVDYPDYGFALGESVVNGTIDRGIAICGSGIGISIACNKVIGIRCAHVSSVKETKMTRIDNDANIAAISGDISPLKAYKIVDAFVNTNFSNEERHIRRIEKIKKYEENS